MGYRSDVTIGLTKALYVKAVLLNNIPKALENAEKVETDLNVFWQIEGWKWYEFYPDIIEIQAWFDWCIDVMEDDDTNESIFGAVRVGEEYGDSEDWGSPGDLDIYISHYISSPFS